MTPIKYVSGDATEPQGAGRKIIAHVCNDCGAWGAGFVLALSAKSHLPEHDYRWWHRHGRDLPKELDLNPFALGEIQFVYWGTDAFVCNMIAQRGAQVPNHAWVIPLQYDALRHCLRKLAIKAHAAGATIHMPRIGCGLAGGTWPAVQRIILQEVSAHNIAVTVYDLPAIRRFEREWDAQDHADIDHALDDHYNDLATDIHSWENEGGPVLEEQACRENRGYRFL
jgi:O-acetyl-ADP-ribose deacetylase (regulator of RNase III)